MHKLIALIAALACALVLAPTSSAQDVINVSPTVGPAGTSFLFYASGFTPGEPISTWLNSPDGRVIAVSRPEVGEATAGGAATWRWESPRDLASGPWQMVVHGRQSGTERLVPFTIGQPAPGADAALPFGVTPTSDRAGASFQFYANGFQSREGVAVSVTGPVGALAAANVSLTGPASEAGRVDGRWIAPDDAAPGQWYISLRGPESGVERVIPVTITATAAAPAGAIEVRPSPGTRDVPFVISASGFAPDEQISVWLNTPDGRVVAADVIGRAQAGPSGFASWGWNAQGDAPLGTWQMVAHGRESGRELVATFAIVR